MIRRDIRYYFFRHITGVVSSNLDLERMCLLADMYLIVLCNALLIMK